MNYTGGPSISGCRPVLSLYPTHRFCQYLLLIFITFTNSFLFNRAFSTNSRRALRRAEGVTAPGCALSGASRQLPQRGRSSTSPSLLRNATSPTEGRPWQSPQSERFRQRLPYQGSCLRSRLRGCTKESLTVSRCWTQPLRHCFAMPPLLVGEALTVPAK